MDRDIRIVVVQGGFVFVGEYKATKTHVTLSSAQCIRKWGTTRGLGQLASGPTKDTVLDAAGFVEIPVGQMLFNIQAHSSWPI